MKRCLMVLAVLTFWAGAAFAAPGDPRLVQGSLEWPSTLSTEPFVVIRGEDGRLYYTDISRAQRRAASSVTAGSRVTALGVEGNRPHELAAIVFGAGDAASLGLTMPPTAPAPSASIASDLDGAQCARRAHVAAGRDRAVARRDAPDRAD